MAAKIFYAEQALSDIESIAAYLTEQNPRAAERVGTAIRRSIERLSIYPLSGRLQDDPANIRKLVVPAYGYLVYYRIESDTDLIILSIRHPAQARLFEDR